MRTPMIVWQGGHSGCGRIVSTAVSVMDITPTLLELAGVSLPVDGPAMDGRSIVPALRGEPLPEPEMLHWDLYGQKAVLQDGRWKLLVNPGWYDVTRLYTEPVYELYDFAADPCEVNNLAAQFPEKVQSLLTAHERWEKENNIIPYAKAIEMGLGRDSASSVGKSKQ
jgi:arylsulfatase